MLELSSFLRPQVLPPEISESASVAKRRRCQNPLSGREKRNVGDTYEAILLEIVNVTKTCYRIRHRQNDECQFPKPPPHILLSEMDEIKLK